jgi:hypothetical protein
VRAVCFRFSLYAAETWSCRERPRGTVRRVEWKRSTRRPWSRGERHDSTNLMLPVAGLSTRHSARASPQPHTARIRRATGIRLQSDQTTDRRGTGKSTCWVSTLVRSGLVVASLHLQLHTIPHPPAPLDSRHHVSSIAARHASLTSKSGSKSEDCHTCTPTPDRPVTINSMTIGGCPT